MGAAEHVAHLFDDGIPISGDVGEHERLVAVGTPQRRRRTERPVRLHVRDVGPLGQRGGEGGPVGGRLRVVDAARRRAGQQDEVRCAVAEASFEYLGGACALRVRILETTVLKHAERSRTERSCGDHEHGAEGEDEPPTTHSEPGQSSEHGGRVRYRALTRYRGDP